MPHKLKPLPIQGNLKIKQALNDGFEKFSNIVDSYCNQNGSHDTILHRGNEKTFLSIFSQGLNVNNRSCYLEMSFDAIKTVGKGMVDYKRRMVDAYICDCTTNNKPLTAVIEAKAVHPWIEERPADSNIAQTKKAIENAKIQLEDIDPEDIYITKGSKNQTYRIALVFTILRVKFAESGEGDTLNWYSYKDILSRADTFFEKTINKNIGENIQHHKYMHSEIQLDLIKDYYGIQMFDGDNLVDRPHKYTSYSVGVLVTAALFE